MLVINRKWKIKLIVIGGVFWAVFSLLGRVKPAVDSLDDSRIEILRMEDLELREDQLLAENVPEQTTPQGENNIEQSGQAAGDQASPQSQVSDNQKEMEELEWALPEAVPAEPTEGPTFVPHALQQEVNPENYRDYETLVKTFYTIDGNTMAGSDQLNVDALMGFDCRIQKVDEPQILIFHTHSKEAFADSVPGDASTGITGVGHHLAEILVKDYGYQVMHCQESFDEGAGVDAYANALPVLTNILNTYPSIQVVIDLHRDEMPEGTHLVTEMDGMKMAKFMFFNGISRTKQTGDIAYLKNDNLDENLSFSFQMQKKAMEYYPGITRKIYLKGYRYNMHMKERYLLIELGAQNNTVEEVMNSCGPIAHILDLVLSGQ